MSVVRKHPWTLTHAFYAAMGGFVLQGPDGSSNSEARYLLSWQGNGVLTPDGVQFLLQHAPDVIPDLALEDIRDRSKADGLAKALLVCQVLWFLLTCINRSVQGLPLSLLEVSTIVHALCSLLTYGAWWYKPKDISQPTIVASDETTRPIGAWMSMASCPYFYTMGGFVWYGLTSEMDEVVCDSDAAHNDPESRDTFHLPATINALFHNLSRVLFESWWDTCRRKFFFGPGGIPWYYLKSFHGIDLPPNPDDAQEEARKLRWSLAYRAEKQHRWRETIPLSQCLVASETSLQAFTVHNALRSFAIAVAVVAVYGLPHLIGFSETFASATEQSLWRIATVLVLVMGTTLGAGTENGLRVGRLLQRKVATSLQWVSRFEVYCRPTLMIADYLFIVVYVFASGFLLVESVRQLFALPPAAFVLPSWGNYWPHFS